MNIVTHVFAQTLGVFKDTPSFRFVNMRMSKQLETKNYMTLLGQCINKVYVDSFEMPRELNPEHLCMFIVEVPYYHVFRKMYQERFGNLETQFDDLTSDQIVLWVKQTYGISFQSAERLLEYFRGSPLKILYNQEDVSAFLAGNNTEPYFQSYTYETIYKYLMGSYEVTVEDYIKTLSKYRKSHTSITKWLINRLEKESSHSVSAFRLLQWLRGKIDSDLLHFAREVV